MSLSVGTEKRPLRVAIIGAGPSGFYAAQALLRQKETVVSVDFFDHLPAPYGLVRYGVAPDHKKIKLVTKLYDRIASDPRVRFFGNVTFGHDLTHEDVKAHYDQVIYAVGAQADRRLGIPGEDLLCSHPATKFVAWYSGHPDFVDYECDLSCESVAVIGVGNVAMDVARILALSPAELARTDIADHALEALSHSRVKDIYIIARRGPAQIKFTNPELQELAELEVTDVIVDLAELVLDPLSAASIADNREAQTNIELLRHYAELGPGGREKRIHFLFLRSPVEIVGDDDGRVLRVKLERNELRPTETGYLNSHGIGEYETLEIGMMMRSVGYRGEALPGVPYHERWGVISNTDGRVSDYQSGEIVPGEYVVGWAKRGPTGVIGTNKPDAVATVRLMLEDAPTFDPAETDLADPEAIPALLRQRDVRYVTWEEWKLIDEAEVAAGQRLGRPRVKFVTVPAMLAAADAAITAQIQDLLIIGGGPAGLYAAFSAGLRGMKARVLEALPDVGGQLATLYPELNIYDMPGFMEISAQALVERLHQQAKRFQPDVEIVVDTQALAVNWGDDGIFLVKDSRGVTHRSRKLIIATGIGAITPNKLDTPVFRKYEGKGVHYFACDKSELRGKKVVVVGGGDSAVLRALNLKDWASEVILVHRGDQFQAGAAYLAELKDSGVAIYQHHEVKDAAGKPQIEQVTMVDSQTGEETILAVDAVIPCLGFKTDRRLIKDMNLALASGGIQVDGFMQTSHEGVYAIGDVAVPAGSVNPKLIATGVAQAVIAVNHAIRQLYPDQRRLPSYSSTKRL